MFRDKKGIKVSSNNLVSTSIKLARGGAADWDLIQENKEIKTDPFTLTALPGTFFSAFQAVLPMSPLFAHWLSLDSSCTQKSLITTQPHPTLGQDFPSLFYLTFKVLFRIRSWCSFSLTTGSLHLFIKDFLYSSLVEIRCSPKGDRLACSKALYKSCKESAVFSSIVSTVMRQRGKQKKEEKIEKAQCIINVIAWRPIKNLCKML